MRKKIIKATSVFCILVLLLSMLTGCTNGVQLHQKYGYNKDFEYNDEMIGHALKSSVVQVRTTYSAKVRYSPVTLDEESLIQLFLFALSEYKNQYTPDEILELVIAFITENITDFLGFGNPKEVEIAPVYTGSGVVISEDGYIATNSHVTTLTEDEKTEVYISALLDGVVEDLEKIVTSLSSYSIEFSDADLEALYEIIALASVKDMRVISENSQVEVCFPTSSGDTSEVAAKHYQASVVAEGTQMGEDRLTQDTSILKIDADNLVALTLDDSYPALNSKIVSAGFPGVANEVFKASGSDAANLALTTSGGTVSRLTPISGSEYQAIGIDTNISNGSSGGPSVDYCLRVEGLNTYASTRDMRFANMVPAAYVSFLSDEFTIAQGNVSKNFLMGLQMLQKGYGTSALECFESVKAANPDTPYIDSLIGQAKSTPEKTDVLHIAMTFVRSVTGTVQNLTNIVSDLMPSF